MEKDKKNEAIELRKLGHSLKEIATQLEITKTKVRCWVKAVKLTDEQKFQNMGEALYKAQMSGSATLKNKYEQLKQDSLKRGYDRAAEDSSFAIIAALYWGEGNNRGSTCALSNSDCRMIALFVRWLLHNQYLWKFECNYHGGNGFSEDEIKAYWIQNVPELADSEIVMYKAKDRQTKTNGKGRQPYGCGKVVVRRGGSLKNEIEGAILYLGSHKK